MIVNENIYFDNNSTTKIDPFVLDAMLPFLTERFGNASSSHEFGNDANLAVKNSRSILAKLLGCEAHEIVFTSGATEAVNFALKGIVEQSDQKKPHIITCLTEHSAVLDTCRYLENKGVSVTYLPVSTEGFIDIKEFEDAITSSTILACIMHVNNETGVIQPINLLSEIAHKHNFLFMSDATQAIGKLPVNVYSSGIDILCFSGHKFYGPKGIGGLFIRAKRPFKVRPIPLLHGGGQEFGLRSGTLNVPGIVGMGKAAEIILKNFSEENLAIRRLRDKLESTLLSLEGAILNGDRSHRTSNTTSICFRGVDADALMVGLKNISLSNGSACSALSMEPSHVLKAMGRSDIEAFSTIRFSLGRFNTEFEIDYVSKMVQKVVSDLRQLV